VAPPNEIGFAPSFSGEETVGRRDGLAAARSRASSPGDANSIFYNPALAGTECNSLN
jgi:hypothetical protein